jgi:hypothetical protein
LTIHERGLEIRVGLGDQKSPQRTRPHPTASGEGCRQATRAVGSHSRKPVDQIACVARAYLGAGRLPPSIGRNFH